MLNENERLKSQNAWADQQLDKTADIISEIGNLEIFDVEIGIDGFAKLSLGRDGERYLKKAIADSGMQECDWQFLSGEQVLNFAWAKRI